MAGWPGQSAPHAGNRKDAWRRLQFAPDQKSTRSGAVDHDAVCRGDRAWPGSPDDGNALAQGAGILLCPCFARFSDRAGWQSSHGPRSQWPQGFLSGCTVAPMSKADPHCVLLADPHHGVSEGVRHLLATMFETVVMVADEVSLFESAARLRSDLAVVDLALSRGNALDFVRRLRGRFPDMRL